MANKFERLLSNPPTWREIPVEYQGEIYTVRGRPDARLIGSTVYLPDPEKQLRAQHYKAFLQDEAEFDLKTVGQVLLVHRCLQTEEGQPQLDETDVAKLAVNHGVLFLALVGASLMAVGLVDPEIPAPAAAVAADPLSASGQDGSSSAGTV